MIEHRTDIIAQIIRAKLNPAISHDPDIIDMTNAIAEIWDLNPSLARRLEQALTAYVNKTVPKF